MIVFRNVDTHAMKGVIVKFTLHPVNRDWTGDYPRCVMDKMQEKFGSNVEVMFTSGFASNHRPLAAQHYPADLGSPRVGHRSSPTPWKRPCRRWSSSRSTSWAW